MMFLSLPANVFSTNNLCLQFGSSSGPVNFRSCDSFDHPMETIDTHSDSDQLRPFHKWGFQKMWMVFGGHRRSEPFWASSLCFLGYFFKVEVQNGNYFWEC